MKIRTATTIASVTVALAIGACASTGAHETHAENTARTHETLGQSVDDGTTTTRVKAALIANPDTEARNIDVETRRGVVQLNGFVNSEHGRTAATKTAAAVEGVKSVENNLQLKGPERTVGVVIDDGVITTKVKLALAKDPLTKAYQIEVSTHGGRVQLGGWVDSADMRRAAGKIAAETEGVKDVDNNLDVKH
jgi:hyperosmotically inducible protein